VPFRLSSKTTLKRWLSEVIRCEKRFPGDLSFVFCSDEYLLEINQKYLNHDYFTDIITFDNTEGDQVNADLLISIDRVKENADTMGQLFIDELHRVMVHGVLHLLGYTDKNLRTKKIMTERENYYLSQRPKELF
jgi:probable rRNA maturation factor